MNIQLRYESVYPGVNVYDSSRSSSVARYERKLSIRLMKHNYLQRHMIIRMAEFCWKQNRSGGGVDQDIGKFVKVTFTKEVGEGLEMAVMIRNV